MEGKVVLLKKTEKESEKISENANIQKSADEQKKQSSPQPARNEQKINAFSASAFAQEDEIVEPTDLGDESSSPVQDFSSTVFTPNYDMMESLSEQQHEKIFGQQEQESAVVQERKRKWSIKSIIFALLFAIFGIWGIVNISTMEQLGSQIEIATETYNINLANYLKNLTALDTTNQENMENLFEVIPSDTMPPTSIGETSNWFDRFCNFLAGLFGG